VYRHLKYVLPFTGVFFFLINHSTPFVKVCQESVFTHRKFRGYNIANAPDLLRYAYVSQFTITCNLDQYTIVTQNDILKTQPLTAIGHQ